MSDLTYEEAFGYLIAALPKDATVYVVQHRVSDSGMTRWLSLYGPPTDTGRLRYLNGWVATVTGLKQSKHGHLVVKGVGMDMHFATVYDLSQALFGRTDPSRGGYALNYQSL